MFNLFKKKPKDAKPVVLPIYSYESMKELFMKAQADGMGAKQVSLSVDELMYIIDKMDQIQAMLGPVKVHNSKTAGKKLIKKLKGAKKS